MQIALEEVGSWLLQTPGLLLLVFAQNFLFNGNAGFFSS